MTCRTCPRPAPISGRVDQCRPCRTGRKAQRGDRRGVVIGRPRLTEPPVETVIRRAA